MTAAAAAAMAAASGGSSGCSSSSSSRFIWACGWFLVAAGEAGEGVGSRDTGDRTAERFGFGVTAGAVGEDCGRNQQQHINSSKSRANQQQQQSVSVEWD